MLFRTAETSTLVSTTARTMSLSHLRTGGGNLCLNLLG
jgi:hypothetical protein